MVTMAMAGRGLSSFSGSLMSALVQLSWTGLVGTTELGLRKCQMNDLLTLEGQKLHPHSEVPPFLNMHPKKQHVSQIHLHRTDYLTFSLPPVFCVLNYDHLIPIKILSFPLSQGGIRDLIPPHLPTWLPLWINSLLQHSESQQLALLRVSQMNLVW